MISWGVYIGQIIIPTFIINISWKSCCFPWLCWWQWWRRNRQCGLCTSMNNFPNTTPRLRITIWALSGTTLNDRWCESSEEMANTIPSVGLLPVPPLHATISFATARDISISHSSGFAAFAAMTRMGAACPNATGSKMQSIKAGNSWTWFSMTSGAFLKATLITGPVSMEDKFHEKLQKMERSIWISCQLHMQRILLLIWFSWFQTIATTFFVLRVRSAASTENDYPSFQSSNYLQYSIK